MPITPDTEMLQHIVQEHPDKDNPDKQFNLMLPFNVYDKNTRLNIIIPNGLKMSVVRSENPIIIRFAGNNSTITVGFDVSGHYQPDKLLHVMLESMHASKQVTLLESQDHGYFGYMDGYRLVKLFDTGTKITSVCYLYVASGPYDSATVLYDMIVDDNETVDSVTQKVKEAFKAHVHVLQEK